MAADAIRVTRNIVSMPSLAKYQPEEFRPGLELQSDEELAKAAGDISTTIFHPVGTCKMGSDDTAVVDARLKVHGLAGPARRRRLRHAGHHLRQHQLADPDDRREGVSHDPGRRARVDVPFALPFARQMGGAKRRSEWLQSQHRHPNPLGWGLVGAATPPSQTPCRRRTGC